MQGIALQIEAPQGRAPLASGSKSGSGQDGQAGSEAQADSGFAQLLAALGGGTAKAPAKAGAELGGEAGPLLSQALASGLPIDQGSGLDSADLENLPLAEELDGLVLVDPSQGETGLAEALAALAAKAQPRQNQPTPGQTAANQATAGGESAPAPLEAPAQAGPAGNGQPQEGSQKAGQPDLADLLAAARQTAQNQAQNQIQKPGAEQEAAKVGDQLPAAGQALDKTQDKAQDTAQDKTGTQQALADRQAKPEAPAAPAPQAAKEPAGVIPPPPPPTPSPSDLEEAARALAETLRLQNTAGAAKTGAAAEPASEASGSQPLASDDGAKAKQNGNPAQAGANPSTLALAASQAARQAAAAANDIAAEAQPDPANQAPVEGESGLEKAGAANQGDDSGEDSGKGQNSTQAAAAGEAQLRAASRREKTETRTAAAEARVQAIARQGADSAATAALANDPAAAAADSGEEAGKLLDLGATKDAAGDADLEGDFDALLAGRSRSDAAAPLSGGSGSNSTASIEAARSNLASGRGAPQTAAAQVALQIQRSIGEGTQQFSIQLDPAELGKVEVRLEFQKDGKLHALVRVERAETLDLLQRDQQGLERVLKESGADLASLDLSLDLGGQAQQGSDDPESQKSGFTLAGASAGGQAEGSEADTEDTPRQRSADGLLDISV